MKKHLSTIIISIFILVILIITGRGFLAHRVPEIIIPGPGVTEVRLLSEWFPGLSGTRGDTEVYILRGAEPGGSVLVMGGNHPNEPSGFMTAIVLIENVRVNRGTLYVIPRSNNSAFTQSEPQNASPSSFTIEKPDGTTRSFRYGSRLSNPLDQWPDPDVYIHASSGQSLSGNETRNLNRAFPGRPDGNFTERIAFGITELIRSEDITLTIDLHEASPEYPVINAMVAHDRAMRTLAPYVILDLEMEGITMGLEPSPVNLRGLTHREFGDFTDTFAVLLETANPSQGRLRGRTDVTLVITGQDKYYIRARGLGRLFVPFDETGHHIDNRVARHLATINALIFALSIEFPESALTVYDIPSYDELNERGLGAFLR